MLIFFFFLSLQLPLYLSLRSDINCPLPNLIRNFRRRDNLTSFLFSLTRSEASCTGVSFPGFFYPRVSEQASATRTAVFVSLPIQFISLRSTHVVAFSLSLTSSISRAEKKRSGEKECRRIERRSRLSTCPICASLFP